MEEKPKSVFEKLDKQEEQIADISEKLENISVDDLYALAKRTWEYGDYQTAQKYYNHISLLRPLDWEAPLYASLCNFKGYHNMYFWVKVPEQLEPIIVSTIEYINNLDTPKDFKEEEMKRCIQILQKNIENIKNHYFKYTKDYDAADANYIFELQEWLVSIIDSIKTIELESIEPFCSFLANCCLSIIEQFEVISLKIDNEKFNALVTVSKKEWNVSFEEINKRQKRLSTESTESIDKLSPEEKKTIQLNGQLFYEYNDKVISKRNSQRLLACGITMVISSIACIVFLLLSKVYLAFSFLFPFFGGTILILRSFKEKARINCYSQLSVQRKRTRLTSNNAIVIENAFSFASVAMHICFLVSIICAVLIFALNFFNGSLPLYTKVVFVASSIVCTIFQFINMINDGRHFYGTGVYKYLYKGQFYTIK